MLKIPYSLIRSSRRTLSLQIDRAGNLIVRAPLRMTISSIEDFIEKKRTWIEKHQIRVRNTQNTVHRKEYSRGEIREMKKRLMVYMIPRVLELWTGHNLPKYTSIKITKSEKRWGSCSAKNGLCFSYRLAEYMGQDTGTQMNIQENPIPSSTYVSIHSPFIDAIIVHELAHLREKHHQKSFWDLVYRMMPEYEEVVRSR